jgi:hypothetical protein
MAEVVEHLLIEHKVLSSNFSTAIKNVFLFFHFLEVTMENKNLSPLKCLVFFPD